ncbi:aerolysin family beta-barrel pore-forming toxin [Chromobacterium amazonense]|uniref:aerolysin family beta-barrel pore-forming toxin n=1 Tax=Chromobacterium amazonense TaxID=1382803 RepID=UPI0031F5FEC8
MKSIKTILPVAVLLVAHQQPAWAADTVPQFSDVIYTEMSPDNESTIQKIVTSDAFFKPWAYLAHYMGYGWVGGNTNGNTAVGKEFEYRRIDTMLDNLSMPDNKYRYMMNAKYDPKGPGGYWADKRFRMAFSNIQWMMEPDDMKLGTPELYNKKPLKVVNVLLENFSDQSDTGVANIKYDSTVSWSKADKISVSGKVTVTNKFSAGLPLIGGAESSVAVEIASGADWTTTNGTSNTTSQTAEYRAVLPPKSKRMITLTLFEQKANIPYTSKMYLTYEAELYNFLRYSDNALNGHPSNRPYYLAKFGGKDGLNGAQDLLSQYLNPATSKWDWPWAVNQYSRGTIEYYIGSISKRKFKQQFTGVFTAVDSTAYTVTAGPVEPLSSQALTARSANLGAAAAGGIQYRVVGGDLKDVPGKIKNLRISVDKPKAAPSAASPLR